MKHNQTDFRSTYQTGSTKPPKNYYSLIAVLLIITVVLCSTVTILGMINIRLFHTSQNQDTQSDTYALQEQIVQVDSQPQVAAFEAEPSVLGLTCEEMDNLYRIYHQLPQGLYISQVEPDSAADQAGIQAGDVLITCDDVSTTKKDRFLSYVNTQTDGTVIHLTVFRNGQQLAMSLTI